MAEQEEDRFEPRIGGRIFKVVFAAVGVLLVVVVIECWLELKADRKLRTQEALLVEAAKFGVALWLKCPLSNLEFCGIEVTTVHRLSDDSGDTSHQSNYRSCEELRLVMGRVRYKTSSGQKRLIDFVVHLDNTTGEVTFLAPGSEDCEQRHTQEDTIEGTSGLNPDVDQKWVADTWKENAERRPVAYSDLLQTLGYYASLNR